MALIVEDGTGKLDADSYQSVAGHRAYCAAHGLTPSADDALVEISLRKATERMVTLYRGSLQGYRTVYNQALDFPRVDLWRDDWDEVGYNTVPPEVLACCSELAVIAETTPLMPTGVGRAKQMIKLGPLTVQYEGNGSQVTVFSNAVSRMIVFLRNSGSGFSTTLVRG